MKIGVRQCHIVDERDAFAAFPFKSDSSKNTTSQYFTILSTRELILSSFSSGDTSAALGEKDDICVDRDEEKLPELVLSFFFRYK